MLAECVIIFFCSYDKGRVVFINVGTGSSSDTDKVTSMWKAEKMKEVSSFGFCISLCGYSDIHQDIQDVPVIRRISVNAWKTPLLFEGLKGRFMTASQNACGHQLGFSMILTLCGSNLLGCFGKLWVKSLSLCAKTPIKIVLVLVQ